MPLMPLTASQDNLVRSLHGVDCTIMTREVDLEEPNLIIYLDLGDILEKRREEKRREEVMTD